MAADCAVASAGERTASSGLPWDDARNERGERHSELRGLHLATCQVAMIGMPDNQTQSATILRDVRKASAACSPIPEFADNRSR